MRKQPAPSYRLAVEAMEDRVVPTVTLVDGTINILGSSRSDAVSVRLEDTDYVVKEGVFETTIPVGLVTSGTVTFSGAAGNDTFRNFTDLRTVADGGAGNDTLYGGVGSDELYGGDGVDKLPTSRRHSLWAVGNDTLDGGAGGDTRTAGTRSTPCTAGAAATNCAGSRALFG